MEGVALLGVFTVVGMLLYWVVVYDNASRGTTRGLFAMREPEDTPRN